MLTVLEREYMLIAFCFLNMRSISRALCLKRHDRKGKGEVSYDSNLTKTADLKIKQSHDNIARSALDKTRE